MRTYVLMALVVALFAGRLAAEEVSSSEARKYAQELNVLLRGERKGALNDFIGRMAALDNERVVGYIVPAATLIPSATNYRAAVDAIAGLQNPEAIEVLVELLGKKKRSDDDKSLVIEAFGRRSDEASLGCIVEQLTAKNSDRVRTEAVRAARARRVKDVIPALLDVLEERVKVRDRVFLETRLALVALSGQNFDTLEDWRKWWDPVKDTFDPATVGEQEGRTQTEIIKVEDAAVQFFGSEIFSRNLVFVIDVSGSMLKYDEGDYEGPDVETARRRLTRAQAQLTEALKNLQRGALFNVIAFSNSVKMWQKTMQPAAPRTLADAVRFVNDFKAIGATHTDEALKQAFEDVRVDTIVFLSDGAPAKTGADGEEQRIIDDTLEWFRDTNAVRKVRINTFGFDRIGQWPERVPFPGRLPPPPTAEELELFTGFLKTLAEESGGTYRPID